MNYASRIRATGCISVSLQPLATPVKRGLNSCACISTLCPLWSNHQRARRLELIAIALLLALALGRLDADLLVVLLERREVLAGLEEGGEGIRG